METQKTKPKRKEDKGLLIMLSSDKKTAFKISCMKKGLTMKEFLTKYIDEILEKEKSQ